jgi:streptomycin 6-kinase
MNPTRAGKETAMTTIPETFARTMAEVYGDEGTAWVDNLPALLTRCAARWGLTLEPPFTLSYNYVAPAVQADGTPVVLKVGVPSPGLLNEIAALRFYDGHGIAQLLDADPAWGALLLERLIPGTMLSEVPDDEEATRIAAGVMRRLWRPLPPGHGFRSVADWAADLADLRPHFGGGTGPLPVALVERAEALFAELLPSQAAPVLLHGDLHHWNIMAAQRDPWLALDPKGIAGEPAYEIGALLRNQIPGLLALSDPPQAMARRVAVLAEELGFDRARLAGWGVAQAVLSAWWSIEDHGYGGEEAITCAELLLPLVS